MARVAACIAGLWGKRLKVTPEASAYMRRWQDRGSGMLALLLAHSDRMPSALRPGQLVVTRMGSQLVIETRCSSRGPKTTVRLRRSRRQERR